eukprot:1156625-Pelagomonas_calceolata.AAC.9
MIQAPVSSTLSACCSSPEGPRQAPAAHHIFKNDQGTCLLHSQCPLLIAIGSHLPYAARAHTNTHRVPLDLSLLACHPSHKGHLQRETSLQLVNSPLVSHKLNHALSMHMH